MEPTPSKSTAPGEIHNLLQAARDGSLEALGVLLQQCRPYLLLIANEELSPDLRAKAAASDLVQESFLEAQKGFAGFHGADWNDLLAWLRCILRHNLADLARRYRQTDARDLSRECPPDNFNAAARLGKLTADSPSPSGHAVANEQALALQRAMEKLPADYRTALLMKHNNASFAEIAIALNRSEGAARKIWFRAVERLRQDLPGYGDVS